MPVPKPILFGTFLDKSSTDAEGVVTYFLDLEGTGFLPSPDVLNQAMTLLPKIGDIKDFSGVVGAPLPSTVVNRFNSYLHVMRVSRIRTRAPDNAAKVFIDVIYKAVPAPTIEFGSSGTQQNTDTYLDFNFQNGNFRSQMKLNWTVPANIFGTGNPAKDLGPLPYTPFVGTTFQFGSTVRISSTFYFDEMTQVQLAAINFGYTTCINKDPLFFAGIPNVDDRRKWLCSSISGVSYDLGFTTRVSCEWVYNDLGWDSIGSYTFNNNPALLKADVTTGLFQSLAIDKAIPSPYLPLNGGAGRWPQQFALPMQNLLGWVSYGAYGKPSTISDVISVSQ